MNKLIRYWNQNRLRIIITVLIIAFIIILIQVINSILESTRTTSESGNKIIEDTSRPVESVITGEKLPNETTNENVDMIKQFVDFNNKKDYQNAYNLLTEECKSKIFNNDINNFISNYSNKIFITDKTYSLELWQYTVNSYTYRIQYTDNNILSTGNINSGSSIEDYITIIENTNEKKLNINSFIEKRTINKEMEKSGVNVKVNDRFMYRDFEEYTFTIKNNTDKTILLSEGMNGNDICLMDSNDIEYDSVINEIPLIDLEIKKGMEKTITIRFYKMYNLYRKIEKICFKNIIMDKDNYKIDPNSVSKEIINIDI